MKRFRPVLAALLLSTIAAGFALAQSTRPNSWQPPGRSGTPAPAAPKKGVNYIDGVPDTGQFLPDTTVLYRVGPRKGTARDFVEFWFASNAEFRPKSDSLGRIEFLNSMINKEVLGLTALSSGRELSFEDRATMREFTQRTLSNTLFQRLVNDSIQVTEDDVRHYWEQFGYSQRFRHVQCVDLATAQRVRADLVAKRITWNDAVKRYSTAKDSLPNGELGWITRDRLDPLIALRIYPLKPGEISEAFEDAEGYQIVQAVERRPTTVPAFHTLRRSLRQQLMGTLATARGGVIQDRLRRETRLTYDTTNVNFASSQFRASVNMKRTALSATFEINDIVPDFPPADTSRVLARWKDGQFTIGALAHAYSGLSPMLRPNLTTFDATRAFMDGLILEPYMADYARSLGLDKDPLSTWQIDRKREELLVGHMFQDSISSRVWVSKEERRAYYEKNKTQFVTYPTVRYAALVAHSRTSADSLAGLLRSGRKAEDLLRVDSLAGRHTGSIQTRRQDEHGPYHKLLFEELRPGRVSVEGPDRQGDFAVIQLIDYDSGRQLSLEESDSYVDESLQNIKAEAMLNEMIARLRKRYPIEWKPEKVMLVRLSDPTLDE